MYPEYSLKKKSKKSLITSWAYKEGVFLSPNGKWIARVRKGSNLQTISQHETKEQAEIAYKQFYNG
jgi:hypothetical protein